MERQSKITPQLQVKWPAFNVKLTSPILSAGTYRVFVERNELVFIQVKGGSRFVLEALAPLFGPFATVIPLGLWLFGKRQTKAKRQHLEQGDPQDLFRESEKNFRLHLAEIRDAAIEAPALFSASRQAGRLILRVRHGEKIQCEFENVTEMKNAVQLLVSLLHEALRVNVEWNEGKQGFEKKKSS